MTKENDSQPHPVSAHALTPTTRRIVNASADIHEAQPDRPEYLHTTMCQLGLPRSRVNDRIYERSSGNVTITLEAGRLMLGGKMTEQILPYGTHPRLVMVHISSEAVRTQNRVIEVGASTREFLRRLGISEGGGKRGGLTAFKRQMQALAACRLTMGFTRGSQETTISTIPIHRFDAWLQHDGKQMSLWPGVMELSQEFFESLLEHAVPLDPRALAALSHSSLALDIYCWLAHRLYRISQRNGLFLSWEDNLMEQFGQEYKDFRNFKQKFLTALRQVRPVYPDAKLDVVRGGIRFYSSPPPIPKTQVVVELPPERSKYLP